MKCLLFAGIIAIVYAPLAFADNQSKVKLVCAAVIYSNPDYINPNSSKVEVQPVNATHNLLHYVFDIEQDFPPNAQFRTDIYRSDAGTINYQWVYGFSVYFCCDFNNLYNQFMADSIRDMRQSDQCGKKGHGEINNVDYVKFYNLLTDDQLKNAYFKVINRVTCGNVVLYMEEFDFMSNCN